MRQCSSILVAALALAACQQPADDSNIAVDDGTNLATSAADPNVATTGANTAASRDDGVAAGLNEADDAGSELPSPPGTPEAGMIPDQYRGRWGMVAADCDQSRSDAKGALTIGERSMIFYESRALLKEVRPAIATSFSGLFAFTGEGQEWQKVVTLTRTGNALRRADDDGSFTYQRCSAKEPS